MKVIINADDYGRNPTINQAIIDAFGHGWITNTTIMANMPSFADGVAQAKTAGFFDQVGLHLNLTQGTPLAEHIRENRLFCDENGEFNGKIWRCVKAQFMLDKISRRNVREEMEAQISKYVESGFPLMHLDSHHHSHTIYSVFSVLRPLLRAYGIKSVRLSANIHKVGLCKRLYKDMYNRKLRHTVEKTTDYFDRCIYIRNMPIEKYNNALVELMCHPDYQEDELVNVGGRKFETLSLLLNDDRIELVSY